MQKSVEVKHRGFDVGFPPVIVDHLFKSSPHGELEHHTDGRLRATVPPEGFEAYAEAYPPCRAVIASITGRTPAPAVTVKPAATKKARRKR